MVNILNNPKMGNWKHGRYFFDKDGNTGTIEYPDGWDFVTLPKENDPGKLAESLHRDNGFLISAGYRAWEAGYVQKSVPLKANQRYLAKAVFKPDVNFPVGQQERTDAVTWQFRMTASTGKVIEQGWQMTGKGQYKQQEENLYVFHCNADLTVDYSFLARSVYAGNDCDLFVYQLTLEEVSADYGGSGVPTLGSASTPSSEKETSTQQPAPIGVREEPQESQESTKGATGVTGPSGKSLGDVLTAAEIDEIASGLRTLASTSNTTVSIGLNKLADGLERLK
ncbi:MAG: hypothetical protein Q9P44_19955 [Anaerolineae bacterium]|nr:hypothetical protein [Anaerolineae bacterium]